MATPSRPRGRMPTTIGRRRAAWLATVVVLLPVAYLGLAPHGGAVPGTAVGTVATQAAVTETPPATPPPTPTPSPPPALPTVYWIFAHPDDETLAAGGALSRSQAAGYRNVVIIVSTGENTAVRSRLGWTRDQIIAARTAELKAAMAVLAIQDLRLLGVPDGQVTTAQVSDLIDGLLREGGPNARFRGHSPFDSYLGFTCGHPDHCAIGTALLQAWRDGRISDLKLYRVGHLFGGPLGEECEALDAQQLAAKRQLIQAYTTANRAAGRAAIGGQSVPGAWVQAARQPECSDLIR